MAVHQGPNRNEAPDYRSKIYRNYVTQWMGSETVFDVEAARAWAESYRYFLRNVLPTDKEAVILDAACGGGKLLHLLKSMGFTNVRGVDISPEQVALSQQVTSDVAQSDIFEYYRGHKGEFDLIIALDLIEHFNKDELFNFLELSHSALKPNGRIILQTPNAASPMGMQIRYGDLSHELGLTPTCLGNLMRMTGFVYYRAWECGPAPHGSISTCRFVLWQMVRAACRAYDLIEVGGSAFPVYSRGVLASAART